ncbi:FCD domain-containing protein [Aliihoeflea aestuarii]|uniref:GntR family transcriptional regulator n=1 Tax=Aliihoeflea aestuarii TaxID=453840 RepID=UPI002095E2C0|nr:GntR family transcriptional regulator [Aliihoeflea aestuarii]MCO6392585.1 FCD domain-containing protein [Aliihoeflea aestuarii]
MALTLRDADRSQPVAPRLYRLLRERVVRGDLLPGTRLSEVEMAGEYAVSRQPVREAFIKLAEEGLVEIRPQRGTFVSRIHVPAVMSARFVREAVEADIVRILADHADAAFIGRLRAHLTEQQAAVESGDPQRFLVLDEAFHRMLATKAGHAASWDVLQPLKTQMDRVRHLSAHAFPLRELLAQHGEVVEAITSGSATGADRAMRGHLRKIIDDLPQIIAAQPAFFEGVEEANI